MWGFPLDYLEMADGNPVVQANLLFNVAVVVLKAE
jgi:hypothetical protein